MRLPSIYEIRDRLRSVRRRRTGAHGAFETPESSDRSRALDAAYDAHLPDVATYDLRTVLAERWVRFHSLPESKRYADTPQEYAEILRRHRTVLDELRGEVPLEDLIVIADDYDWNSPTAGWTQKSLPSAWPWRATRFRDCNCGECPPEEDWEHSITYRWASSGLTAEELDSILLRMADWSGSVLIGAPDLSWVFAQYDGGVDVYPNTSADRDDLKARHSEWLSSEPSGL